MEWAKSKEGMKTTNDVCMTFGEILSKAGEIH